MNTIAKCVSKLQSHLFPRWSYSHLRNGDIESHRREGTFTSHSAVSSTDEMRPARPVSSADVMKGAAPAGPGEWQWEETWGSYSTGSLSEDGGF